MKKTYQIKSSNHVFTMNDPTEMHIQDTEPHALFVVAMETMNSLAIHRLEIESNTDLSAPGKAKETLNKSPMLSTTHDARAL